ncbi:hypothetical protein MKW98_013599 [Papaver atlanticum]|uniref:Uncharacterized protein n=1 Tax=Papaver atlanticum TaxID=357466 RepID=A0AAD4X4T8_9MAGN|nr:hypothetical protein MKW98_013599 [Papaver atlanticum]
MICEVLETSKAEFKPIFVISISSNSSDSIIGEVSSKKGGSREMVRGTNSTSKKDGEMVMGTSTTLDSRDVNENMHREVANDNDDAASQTSSGNKRTRLDNNDGMEMAKGVHDKLKVHFNKLKESGSHSGIEFTNREINFVSDAILSHKNAFRDEFVT